LSRSQEVPLATNVGHGKPENMLSEYLALWVNATAVSRVIVAAKKVSHLALPFDINALSA
jgi:hypothetical protein